MRALHAAAQGVRRKPDGRPMGVAACLCCSKHEWMRSVFEEELDVTV
jgi:hypothetical protein